jgi:hypothetical protein
MPIPAIVGAAAVTGISQLFGAKKGSNAAKDAAEISNDFGQKALDEQKRVYDLERADEQRQREARAGIFDQYGTNPGTFGGNLPNPYGMDNAQTAAMRQGNMGNQGNQGNGAKMMPQSQPQPGDVRTQPVGRPVVGGGLGKPTVMLQAPTGETMEVDLDQAPALIKKGAVIIPKQGGQNAFGGSYGVV